LGRPLAIDDVEGSVRLVLLGRIGPERRLRPRLWFYKKGKAYSMGILKKIMRVNGRKERIALW